MNNFTYMTDRNFSKGRKYIGASDMATISGINPYKTPLQLWEELTGKTEPFHGNSRTAWGHKQEPMILGEYVRKVYGENFANGFIYSRLDGKEKFNDLHSWTEAMAGNRLCAHADLLDLSGDFPIIIQAKNTGEFAAGSRKKDKNKGYDPEDFSSSGIPLAVYLQEQWEMMCYGISVSYVAVLIGGYDWRLYGPIDYSKKTCNALLTLAERMLDLVDRDEPPKPETWDDVVRLFPDFKPDTKTVVSGDDEFKCRSMLHEYAKLSEKEKDIGKKKDDIKNALGLYLGGNQYLQTPEGITLASASEIPGRETVSVKELKKNKELFSAVESAGLIKIGKEYRKLDIKNI